VSDFDDFVNSRGPGLLRFAYLLTGNAHHAEDIVQDALARAHTHWSKISQYQVPEAYVRKTVLRLYLSWRRRRASTEIAVAEVGELGAHGADQADRIAVRQQLGQILATLPRMQRAVLVLRYFEDRDDDDIANLLGCAPATVRVHAARGLRRMRAELPTADQSLEV
jgi:RNA polymerase sigma-70 factor (sigma-E family)